MKAAIFQGAGQPLKIVETARPAARPGELAFKVMACGICASDLHAAEAGIITPGVILGHEYTGEVTEVGPGVSGWQVGETG
ncbi:MAG: alcohol dehydrogenase catalytic domain-containing protein [Proteobacteria bacterium]|nr:alcohol dehydrogenase catalytic domain-containing protein [Pseudomonadota bacterium]